MASAIRLVLGGGKLRLTLICILLRFQSIDQACFDADVMLVYLSIGNPNAGSLNRSINIVHHILRLPSDGIALMQAVIRLRLFL